MIAVNWYGPYRDIDDARKVANYDWLHGLYMGIGKARYERVQSLQYIGIGGTLATRLSERHHKLSKIVRSREIWLGEIATAEPSGKRMKATPATLDYAEWLHARFLRLPLNDKKTKNLPSRSVTVLNRWFGCDYDTQRGKRPHRNWPDLIDFPSDGLAARAVWFGSPGRQTKFLAPDYARPTE